MFTKETTGFDTRDFLTTNNFVIKQYFPSAVCANGVCLIIKKVYKKKDTHLFVRVWYFIVQSKPCFQKTIFNISLNVSIIHKKTKLTYLSLKLKCVCVWIKITSNEQFLELIAYKYNN